MGISSIKPRIRGGYACVNGHITAGVRILIVSLLADMPVAEKHGCADP